jgi:hypothetical protein
MLYLEPPAKKVHTGLLAGLLATFRSAPARQVNAGLTGEMPAGRAPLVVRVGGKIAGESALEVKR